MPIDINWLREDKGGDPEKWREHQRARFQDAGLVDEVLRLDAEWRKMTFDLDAAKTEYNKANKSVAKAKKAGEDAAAIIESVKALKEKVAELVAGKAETQATRDRLLRKIANAVDPSVPVSKDEAHNLEVKVWGECVSEGKPLNHHDLLHMIGGYEPERGVGCAGHRAYYLTGPGVLLNQALVQYGLAFLRSRGDKSYTPVQPPFFMNKEPMGAVAQLEEFDEALYKVSGETEDGEKYLIATSEQPLCAFHMGETLEEKELPKRYAGYSTCFRKEAGSHGRDTWGIFRVHQFEKVEQFCITTPEESAAMQDEMIATAEEFYQSLGLAYHVVNIVSGELNNAAAKKLDLEAWFPGYNAYRELVSCSNCLDYQSRGMEIRCGSKKEGEREKRYVHMLNATLVATTRTLCCILENYQTADGVRVPDVLVPFTGGVTFFPFVNEKKVNITKERQERAAAKKGGKGGKGGGKFGAKKGKAGKPAGKIGSKR
eukprot:CAMPEP_0203812020 /NCGR_PEP_ID=MMETSP0115-20131106/3909_1 /ASSEMBLY_ACC=CAM_ASM_000227 /TAXON_ID=33651 /ORGANISM="Bicosoecid sp, Strain ms1" /LENGTH=485 /DNA_ID=CAMNT_0050720857 /DNA_START=38 /DNA_END=1491 /DNA_ORIENTATION=-